MARLLRGGQGGFPVKKGLHTSFTFTWPRGVISLSHIVLPFSPDDPLYGLTPPTDKNRVYLDNPAIQGERGLLNVPENWLHASLPGCEASLSNLVDDGSGVAYMMSFTETGSLALLMLWKVLNARAAG